ncbi:MAG: hypothetical protein ACPG5B_10565 [Chitinophagales bacterium]
MKDKLSKLDLQKVIEEKRITNKLSDISIKGKNIVDALSGIASKENTNQDVNVDFKKEHLDYLMEKYK